MALVNRKPGWISVIARQCSDAAIQTGLLRSARNDGNSANEDCTCSTVIARRPAASKLRQPQMQTDAVSPDPKPAAPPAKAFAFDEKNDLIDFTTAGRPRPRRCRSWSTVFRKDMDKAQGRPHMPAPGGQGLPREGRLRLQRATIPAPTMRLPANRPACSACSMEPRRLIPAARTAITVPAACCGTARPASEIEGRRPVRRRVEHGPAADPALVRRAQQGARGKARRAGRRRGHVRRLPQA